MSQISNNLSPTPNHVPSELVVDWDFNNPPNGTKNLIGAWKSIHDGPDIIWTPRNGGHWIFTRAEDIEFAQKNHDPFSMDEVNLPPAESLRILPLESDPPAHGEYRRIIVRYFSPAAVKGMEESIRALTVSLIEDFRKRGCCEFMQEFAMKLPITIFLKMVDLPLSDAEELLVWTEASVRARDVETREWAQARLLEYMNAFISQRQASPGDDLVSTIVNARAFGRPLTMDEIHGMLVNVIFGGLDTVASTMGLAMMYLANHPEQRKQLTQNPDILSAAVEELLRMFAPASTARVITRDYEYKNLLFKKNDMVYLKPGLHGLDERVFDNPLEADFDRKNLSQIDAFGHGPHRCPGSYLARMEIRILLEEWFQRIPEFQLAPGEEPEYAPGVVSCVTRMPLVWEVPVS